MTPRSATLLALVCLMLGCGLVALGRRETAEFTAAGRPRSIGSVDWDSSATGPMKPAPSRSGLSPASIDPGRGPTRLTIARLHLRAAITTVTTVGARLQVPVNPRVVGWWSSSAAPGAGAGAVVIDGHINYAGVTGALSVVPRTRAGDLVTVTQATKVVRYVIRTVHTYPKSSGLPVGVFRTDGPPGLNLITCGGPFDVSTGDYEDNIVAFALLDQ